MNILCNIASQHYFDDYDDDNNNNINNKINSIIAMVMDKMMKKHAAIVKNIDKTKSDIEALLNEIKVREDSFDNKIKEHEDEYAAKIKQLEESNSKKRKALDDDKDLWEQEKKNIATSHTFDARIKLDVGGTRFTTTLTTLTRFPDTMLGAMFSGRHQLPLDESGHYFIDRDGTHFRHILNYLRCPEEFDMAIMEAGHVRELRKEVRYYGLESLMFIQELEAKDSVRARVW